MKTDKITVPGKITVKMSPQCYSSLTDALLDQPVLISKSLFYAVILIYQVAEK